MTIKKKPAAKKPAAKKVKKFTRQEWTAAVIDCKLGDSLEDVGARMGISASAMCRRVERWKPVSPAIILELLQDKLALHLSATGAILPASISATVAGIKMIIEQGGQSETQETLDKILELGTKVYKMMKGEDEAE